MERLTFVDEDGLVLFDNPAGFPDDIGFTIRELTENEEWKVLDNIAQRLANCEQRLKHYEDLEEQGKLLKLPCAVGDAIFRINKGAKIPIISMEVHEISMFYSRTNNFVIQIKCHDDIDGGEIFYSDSEFGRTVFLTKSAAEQALKEMEES